MNASGGPVDREPSRFPVRDALIAVGVLVLLVGGWIAYRLASPPEPVAKRSTTSTSQPATTQTSTASDASLEVAPPPRLPGQPLPISDMEPPANAGKTTVVAIPGPEAAADQAALDAFVAQEAPKYEIVQPAGGRLESISSASQGPRDPSQVAAEIDRLIYTRLAEAKIPSSPRADDAEFLRRVYLDLTGTVPSVAKTKSFLADREPSKRDRLIDELLASPAFGEHSAHYWHELLVKRDPDNNQSIQTHDVFVKWLARQFNQGQPWDHTVRSMLTAQGDQALAGETFFVLANTENGQPAPNKIVGTAAALFLGNQLMCAECHVHPNVSGWKQQDFWGLAAFFGRTKAVRSGMPKQPNSVMATIEDVTPSVPVKGKKSPTETKTITLSDGSIPIPDPRNDGKVIGATRAKLFGEGYKPVPSSSVNRGFAADWFVAAKNPFFPRATANRLWARLFSRGLINPLDDIRPESQPSHPQLLQLLSEELVASKFDIKHLTRCLCRTEAYQRSSRTTRENETDEDLYSHMPVKVIPPRDLFASLKIVTNGKLVMREPRLDGKKNKGDSATSGLAFFDTREYDESPAEYTYGVPQLLRLLNTELPPVCDVVALSLPRSGGPPAVIDHLYLLALARHPSPVEVSRMNAFLSKYKDSTKGYSAALWALLSSAEFMNNH